MLNLNLNRQAYFILATIVSAFVSFFVNYYLSQKLSLIEYGKFSLVYSTMALFMSFMLFGQATSITLAYFSDEKKKCNNISNEMVNAYKIIGLASFLVFVVTFLTWHFLDNQKYTAFFISLFLFAIFCKTFQTFYLSVIVMFDRYKVYLATIFLSSVVLVVLVVINPSINGYLQAVILSSLVLIIVGLYLHYQHHQHPLESKVFTKKELFIFGGAAIPGMLISSLNSYIDRYTLNYFLDLEVVAYYSLAAVVGVGIGTVVIAAILKGNTVSMFQILQENNKDKYLNLQKNINIVLAIIAILATVTYYFIGQWLIINIFGDKYEDSVSYILPLFLTIVLNGVMQIYAIPLVQKKKLYVLVYISAVVVVVNIVLNVLFINIIGVSGVILAMFLAILLNLIIVYFYARRDFNYMSFPYSIVAIISALEVWSLA